MCSTEPFGRQVGPFGRQIRPFGRRDELFYSDRFDCYYPTVVNISDYYVRKYPWGLVVFHNSDRYQDDYITSKIMILGPQSINYTRIGNVLVPRRNIYGRLFETSDLNKLSNYALYAFLG